MSKWQEFPLGLKILIVLGYVSAGMYILLGGALLGSAEDYKMALYEQAPLPYRAALGEAYVGMAGIGFILLGVLAFFVTRSLNKGENWARIVTIIYAALAILGSLAQLGGESAGAAAVGIVLYGFVIYHLAFNAKVKGLFGAG